MGKAARPFQIWLAITLIFETLATAGSILVFVMYSTVAPNWQLTGLMIALFAAAALAFGFAIGISVAIVNRKDDRKTRIGINILRTISVLMVVATAAVTIVTIVLSFRIGVGAWSDLQILGLGSVSTTTQSLLLRHPTATSLNVQYGLLVPPLTQPALWIDHPIALTPLEADDFTAVITLTGLLPNTLYAARLLIDGTAATDEATFVSFRTLPSTATPEIVFTFGSCTLPFFFRSMSGWETMQGLGQRFHLHLGDFMYADHPMWFGESKEAFEVHYRDIYHDEYFQKFARQVPLFYIYDDHEIFDNYDDGTNTEKYNNAITAWAEYNERTNPGAFRNGSHYFAFSAGDGDFFVVDTRQYRSSEDEADGPGHTMLGSQQLADLKQWLSTSTASFKFVATSVPMALHSKSSDCWFGYQTERTEILDYITANNITGVTFLSGDRHWAGVFELRPGIFEFSISPIDAFFDETAPKQDDTLGGEKVVWVADFQNMGGRLTYSALGMNLQVHKTYPKSDSGAPIFDRNFAFNNGRFRLV